MATQLKPTSDPATFTAPDLQYFMDSPTEISNFFLREWTEESAGGPPRRMRFAIHYAGPEAQVDTLVELTKRVVKEEKGIYGELPQYDFGYVHVRGGLPAVGEWRWHGASQLDDVGAACPGECAAPQHDRHRVPRILPFVEHGAHPRESDRAVRLRACEHVGRAVAR